MKLYPALFIILLAPILISCKKTKNGGYSKERVDSLELHLEGGFAGQSLHYVIAAGAVYKDTMSRYQHEYYNWTVKLPDDKYKKVKDLPAQIPQKLYDDGTTTYGSNEGTADFATIWVVSKTAKGTYTWTFEYQGPDYVKEFERKAGNAIQALNE